MGFLYLSEIPFILLDLVRMKIKNHLIISILILSVGFSQRLSEVIETYDYGNIKSITYHKKTENNIEIVKYEKYYENGHKEEERTYKNGEKIKETYWDENGQKWYEITYKDDQQDEYFTKWYKNGQMEEEGTYKDGKEDGLWTKWYKNGQMEREETYKDGNIVSYKRWNEDGSVNND